MFESVKRRLRPLEVLLWYPRIYDRLGGRDERKRDSFFEAYSDARRTMGRDEALFYAMDLSHVSY